MLHCQAHGNSGMSQPSFQSPATVMQPSHIPPPRFPAVVDPLTQAAVAQVGAVYQAAAAAAYKAVAASGLMPNLSQNVPSLAPQPSQPQAGQAREFNILNHIKSLSQNAVKILYRNLSIVGLSLALPSKYSWTMR